MSKIKTIISTYLLEIILTIALALCLWAILAIQLEIDSLIIKNNLPQKVCDNINKLYINITYSFLAGYIFYLLTVYFPKRFEKKRLQPIFKQKIYAIKNDFNCILLEFSRNTEFKNGYLELENARKVLMSKNWTDNMPIYQNLYKDNISYISFISEEGKIMKKQINDFIQSYQSYITVKQLCLLEELSNMMIFSIAHQFSQMTISLEDANGKKSLVDMFINALSKMYDIEYAFNL